MATEVSPDDGSFAMKREPTSPAHGRALDATSPSNRGHPYNRRPSLPALASEQVPRIHLPPPNIGGHSNSTTPRQTPTDSQPVNIPGISSLALGSPRWRKETDRERERYWDDRQQRPEGLEARRPHIGRSVSGDSAPPTRPSLPPLRSLGMSEPGSHTPTSTSVSTPMSIPPPTRHRTGPPSPHYTYSRPPSPPPAMASQAFSSQRYTRHDHRDQDVRHGYPAVRDVSPPLRAMHPYDMPHHRPPPDMYQMGYRHNDPHRYPQIPIDPYTGRPMRHPGSGSSVRRQDDIKPPTPHGAPPGQSRRLAHLMSEQKRRESINSGFQALRKVVPAASPTDSKAVILRKAAAHIAHLDAIIRDGGSGSRPMPPDISPEEDEIMLSDDAPEDEEDEGSDVSERQHLRPRTERTTGREGWDKKHSRSC